MLGISRISPGDFLNARLTTRLAPPPNSIDRYVDLLSEEFNKVTPENSVDGPAIPIVHNTCLCSSTRPLQDTS